MDQLRYITEVRDEAPWRKREMEEITKVAGGGGVGGTQTLPVVCFLNQATWHAHPNLHSSLSRAFLIRQRGMLTLTLILMCIPNQATWHAFVIYFVPMYSMCTPNASGVVYDWVEIGCTMYMAIVMTINLKLAMKSR